jgi:ferredoxin
MDGKSMPRIWERSLEERRKAQEGGFREMLIGAYAPREPRVMEGLFKFLQSEKKYPLRLVHKIIDRLAGITIATTVMTYQEIVTFVQGLPDEFVIARGPCACRLHTAELGPDARDLNEGNLGLCRQTPLDVDIQIGTCGKHFGMLSTYTMITKPELLQIEEQCHNMGLVANVYTMLAGEAGICHCSSLTCVPFIANEVIDQGSTVIRPGSKISRTSPSRCKAHGDCVQVCHFNARRIMEHHGKNVSTLVDPNRCYGCGYCAEVCPEGAIMMVERKELASQRSPGQAVKPPGSYVRPAG